MIRRLRESVRFLVKGGDQLAAIGSSLTTLGKRLKADRDQIRGLKKSVQHLTKRTEHLDRHLQALRTTVGRNQSAQGQVLEDLRREAKQYRMALQNSGDTWRLHAETRETLTAIANARTPVVVGPWLSEVGFEVLYWVPFLRWCVREFGIEPARLTVLTRGGADCWYEGLVGNAIEIHEITTVDQLRAENQARREGPGGSQKQAVISSFEQGLIERARDRMGVSNLQVLHPSIMYELFRSVWRGVGLRTLDLWDRYCLYETVTRPSIPQAVAEALPEEFVAVRFYDRPTFPQGPETSEFVASLLERLAKRSDVVLLNPGFSTDDHRDFEIPDLPGVHRIDGLLTPGNNLLVQSQVISRAKAFVGTYGGLAYVPALYGVPSLSFYAGDVKFPSIHLDVAQRAMIKLKAPFTVMHTDAAAAVRHLL